MAETTLKAKDIHTTTLANPPEQEYLVQPVIRAEHLPPRIQRIMAILLTYQDVICGGMVGDLEFHFHQDSVKAKVQHNLS